MTRAANTYAPYELDAATVGGNSLTSYVEGAVTVDGVVTTIAASGASQVISFGATPAVKTTCFDITLSAACAVSIVGGIAGYLQRCTLILRQPSSGTGYAVTLPAVRYRNGSPPTVSTTADMQITFATSDGGVTIFGDI